MCIAVFMWKSHPLYPLILLLNRDEFYDRPTMPLHWWDEDEILGGKDEQEGGTWLATSRNGKFVFVTNVREVGLPSKTKSRGDLPLRYLKGKKSPRDFAEELAGEIDPYRGYNLIIADLHMMSMVYLTNRPKDCGLSIIDVSPGIHVLSNAELDTPWPKAERLRTSFENAINKCGEAEVTVEDMSDNLMNDTSKDLTNLPGIYNPEFEYDLSSIFVEAVTTQGRYGTRSTSAVVFRRSGEVCFYERYLEKDTWKKNKISYFIEK